jgi:hypothetical protein
VSLYGRQQQKKKNEIIKWEPDSVLQAVGFCFTTEFDGQIVGLRNEGFCSRNPFNCLNLYSGIKCSLSLQIILYWPVASGIMAL